MRVDRQFSGLFGFLLLLGVTAAALADAPCNAGYRDITAAEYRADEAAEIYLARAGFNPMALYSVLQKMAALGSRSGSLNRRAAKLRPAGYC